MNSYFYLQSHKTSANATLIEKLEKYAEESKVLIYILDSPLTDNKYKYKYNEAIIMLSPKQKIAIIDYGNKKNEFEDFVEDVIEDIGSISDKYLYKDIIGRPRKWKNALLKHDISIEETENINSLFSELRIIDDEQVKKIDLLISLFIGSINDMERVKLEVPFTLLDKVKQKIQLFDGEQTRFIYEVPEKKRVNIQGLSGTGKTELLLHKLKDLYTTDSESRIVFTCYSKILADSLRKRIPVFFNFMKVEQQIEWNERLWCNSSWGSSSQVHSGAYINICDFYGIPFYRYSFQMSFSRACRLAIDDIKSKYGQETIPFAYTYMFIDESQDFSDDFFELCELVTERTIFVAGDIFQSIFDAKISPSIDPDFLLGKCYRTDPKTLMFAHGLGMGLFESTKFRWLERKEWGDCGYNVKVENRKYYLSREPIRRFEDLDDTFESIKIVEYKNRLTSNVIQIIKSLQDENSTLQPDDIGIIFLDLDNSIYAQADELEVALQTNFSYTVNKAYETKTKRINTIFISNRNNVKGLEFPFVICITNRINKSSSYRNSLYTMLTRSFLKSFLVIPISSDSGLTEGMKAGLLEIVTNNRMVIEEPSVAEKKAIQTRFEQKLLQLSHYDKMMEIFNKHNIKKAYHEKFFQLVQQMELIESDIETLDAIVKTNLQFIVKDK